MEVTDVLDVRSLWLEISERFIEWIVSPSSDDPAPAVLGCYFEGEGGGAAGGTKSRSANVSSSCN